MTWKSRSPQGSSRSAIVIATPSERSRRSCSSALSALRGAFLAAARDCDPIAGFAGPEFSRMIADSPTLATRLRDLHDQREEALAEALADATGAAPDDITPRAVAAQIGAVHRVLFQRIQELTLAGCDNARISALVAADAERVFGLLEPSLADYAVRAH